MGLPAGQEGGGPASGGEALMRGGFIDSRTIKGAVCGNEGEAGTLEGIYSTYDAFTNCEL